MTIQLLEELQCYEDALCALKNGYYDTHDLEFIKENKEEYEKLINDNKHKLPKNVYYFSNCKLVNEVLISKY